jgi:hypothetical protein
LTTAYFDELNGAFQEAKHGKDGPEFFYNIAGSTVRLNFAGEALVPSICPALEHLKIKKASKPSLSIYLWDSTSTNTKLPVFPWEKESLSPVKDKNNYRNIDQACIYFIDQNVRGAYQVGANTLSMLDITRNLALYWSADASQTQYYESSAPLRIIFQWWAQCRDLQLIHAGAVGKADRGVLLAGASGSGKSVTALSSIKSDLLYAGDDYVLASTDPVPYVYSLYNGCKLLFEDIKIFPGFVTSTINQSNSVNEKALMFLHDYYPEKLVAGFRIQAVVLPRVTGNRTRLKSISAVTALKALAPSTIFQLPGTGQEDLKRMSKLVRQIPSYILELGEDNHAIPGIILNLLS